MHFQTLEEGLSSDRFEIEFKTRKSCLFTNFGVAADLLNSHTEYACPGYPPCNEMARMACTCHEHGKNLACLPCRPIF